MRIPIPPGWRQAVRAGGPWPLIAAAAAVAGGAWLLSPAATLQRVAEKRGELVGRAPNATGRALGMTAGDLTNRYQDPIEILAMRAAVMRAGSTAPTYRGGRSDYFRPSRGNVPEVTWPLPTQNLRPLGAQQPFRGEPIQAGPGVALTAADVLAAQLDTRKGATSA